MADSAGRTSHGRTIGRLAAEFAIIVVGVLVALAVDQWRDESTDRDLADFYLSALEDDLENDSIALASSLAVARSVRASAAAFDELLASEDEVISADSLQMHVTMLLFTLGFQANTETFDDLTNSGNSRLIRSPELRNRLQRYVVSTRSKSSGVEENGLGTGRNSFPPILLQAPVFAYLRERLESPGAFEFEWEAADALRVLRGDAEALQLWLRRRQLHASFVVGELEWILHNSTLPLLGDIRDAIADRPLRDEP